MKQETERARRLSPKTQLIIMRRGLAVKTAVLILSYNFIGGGPLLSEKRESLRARKKREIARRPRLYNPSPSDDFIMQRSNTILLRPARGRRHAKIGISP